MSQLLENLRRRRSIYQIGKNVSAAPDEIVALIEDVVEQIPSSFNGQTSRVVVLFGQEHHTLWQIVKDTLRPLLSDEQFEQTSQKVDGLFAAGFGTVLFFEDQDAIQSQQEQFALYAEHFPQFSEQHAGMVQLAVWTALAEAGIGATLQHYNPLINEAVAKQWQLPAGWLLRAQMPFGSIEAPAGEKTHIAREERFKVFK